MERVYNFSAGPAVLPEEVLKQAASEMTNYKASGMSVMEMSHRSAVFDAIIKEAEADLRDLLAIPDNYAVLFLQGGASLQFAMAPINLAVQHKKAAFINTGAWSKKAITEAKRMVKVDVLASSEDKNFTYIPEIPEIAQDLDYLHLTSNNTIFGTRFTDFPDSGNVPLVVDMSSDILSRPLNISNFGLIFAGAQKNMGPAGLTTVILRKDLIGKHSEDTPIMLRYATHAEKDSMFNTPPCYAIYITGLVFKWLKKQGGLKAMQARNEEKAALLYDFLDNSRLFSNPVNKKDRSLMNVTFVTGNPDLDKAFISQAAENGLVNLKGHRSVGGMRASIYNAMPVEGVKKLISFMKEFEAKEA